MLRRLRRTAVICGACAGLVAGCGSSGHSASSSSSAAPPPGVSTQAAASTPSATSTPVAAASTQSAAATTAAPTSTAASSASTQSQGARIKVTPALIAETKTACTQVGLSSGQFKAVLVQACNQLDAGDVASAAATYNSICQRQAALSAQAGAVRDAMARMCPKFVVP